MTKLEEVAVAIEDAQIGYSIRLTRLVDGVSTYECRIDGLDGVLEFKSHGEALDFVTARRREVQARAAIEAMREPTQVMIDAMDDHAGTLAPQYAYMDAIDAALSEGKEEVPEK